MSEGYVQAAEGLEEAPSIAGATMEAVMHHVVDAPSWHLPFLDIPLPGFLRRCRHAPDWADSWSARCANHLWFCHR